jgi:hypothetical protein
VCVGADLIVVLGDDLAAFPDLVGVLIFHTISIMSIEGTFKP